MKIKLIAEAHSNLNLWAAIVQILEGGLLYGAESDHKGAERVIAIAKSEQQKWLLRYDKLIAEGKKS